MSELKILIISVRCCRMNRVCSLADLYPISVSQNYRINRVSFFSERTFFGIELCSFSQMQFTLGYCEDRTYILLQITLLMAKKKTKINSLLLLSALPFLHSGCRNWHFLCENSVLAQSIIVPHAGNHAYEKDKYKIGYIKYNTPARDNVLVVS